MEDKSAAVVGLNDEQAKGEETIPKGSRSSGRSRKSGSSRSPKRSRSSRSGGRSPTSQSRKQIIGEDHQTSSNNVTTKRRSGRAPKSLSGSAHSRRSRDNESIRSSGRKQKKMIRSSSADDIQLLEDRNEAPGDAWSLALNQTENVTSGRPSNNLKPSQSDVGAIPGVPLGTPSASVKKRAGSPKSPRGSRSPRRQNGRRSGRRKSGDNKKSSTNSSPTTSRSTASTDGGEEVLMGETVDEQNEVNRERVRDLEIQSGQIQQRMEDKLAKKKKKKGDAGPDSASNGGRRITIWKVLGIAAVYLAGIGTGFLISELRQRKASLQVQEVFVTQTPTAPVVPSYDPTTAPTEFSYDEPTQEDCFAIESKEEVNGQDGMITRSYDVHFDVQLNDSSTDWHEQLEEGVTDKVIPDLACCRAAPTEERLLVKVSTPMDLSIRGGHMNRMLRNIRCVVANGLTRGENNDNGESCVELTGLCIPAVVTLDLTLKGDEADGDIMDLVRNVIQGDGSEPLVEKFDLETNVFSVVKLVDVVDHVPTQAPMGSSPTTSRPTLSPTATSAPVSGPSTNAPTRVVTQSPTARLATPPPTSAVTQSPTFQPAPGVTPRPTPQPTDQPNPDPTPPPSSEPSPGPTESPSSFPTLVPTLLATPPPTSSPTTPVPSLTPSSAPTGRREVLEGILAPVVGTIDTSALDWLADTDTWNPPITDPDPDSMWAERYAMVQLYLATNGASWTNKGGWMTSTTICDWTPDACNGNNRIEEIDLNENGLSGNIPTEIGLLRDLVTCDIDDNDIQGTIPTEIGLPKLRHLDIDNNNIQGTIPSELGLTMMTLLDISRNSLVGSIPPDVLSLSNIRWFRVKDNRLSGTIGSELGAMSELLDLSLKTNQLSGSLPSEIGLLTALTYMSIQQCSFTGAIPSEIGLATMLTFIDFDFNDLSGAIPTTLGRMTKLTSIDLDWNNLSGPVPTELGRLTVLRALDLDHTNLSGTIPTELNLIRSLEHFEIDDTRVSGPIPNLNGLVNLDTLGIANCQLTGSFPPGMFDNMVKLELVNFSRNSLTGAIPALPNPSLLTTCSYSDNCFTSDLANAGTCELANNCA